MQIKSDVDVTISFCDTQKAIGDIYLFVTHSVVLFVYTRGRLKD
jgi:hypothetical protein